MLTFSIGIPAFKSIFLKECIDSILNQTYTNFELIIIDDYSPESIDKIVASYSDSRLKYFRNDTNIGAENVVDNWNKCLEKSVGDYFILMGDDDRMEVDYLEEFIDLIYKYPDLDIYHCRSKIINEKSIPYSITPINPEYENIYDYLFSCLKNHRQQYISDFVYKSNTLKSNGGFYKLPLAWGSDYLSAYIACCTNGIAHTNKTVFNYRINQYSLTSTGNVFLKRKALIAYENWVSDFLDIIPTDTEDIFKRSLAHTAFIEYREGTKMSIIRQTLGQLKFTSCLTLLKSMKELQLSYSDILYALVEAIYHKSRK
jgi:glycosyltransferase involved in cell wall biosynthesis